jgi:hypothetical protein
MNQLWRVTTLIVVVLVGCLASLGQEQDPNDTADPGQASSAGTSVPSSQWLPSVLRQVNKTLSYGASFLQGYSSSRENGITSNQAFFAFLPFVSLDLSHNRTQLILQSTPVISYVPSQEAGFGINGFLDPRVGFAVRVSPTVVVQTSLGVTYGNQYLHVMGLSVPSCTDICSGSLAQQSQSAPDMSHDLTAASFAAYGEVGVNWQRSQRQGFSVMVGKSYSTSPAEDSEPSTFSNATYARGQFIESITPLFGVGTYTQVHYLVSPGFECASTGVGVVVQQQVNRSTSWSAQGGPEFGDLGCGQRIGIDIAGTFRRTVVRRTLLIVTASHNQNTYFVPGSRWATSVDLALHHQLSDRLYCELNGGYLSASAQYDPNTAFSGAFISPSILWRFANNFSLSAGYGHLGVSHGDGSVLARDWALIGITWHGKPKQL